jgi:hypothetical protein
MKGLADKTERIFSAVSELPCTREYTLIGGTALALQINHRKSEDLDFCIWSKNPKTDRPTVNWPVIERELAGVGSIQSRDILGFDQVNFVVGGVNISYITRQEHRSPVKEPVSVLNNILAADVQAIGAMKIELMLRRSEFRDYYDIYSILREGHSLKRMVDSAVRYSGHRLKTRNALSHLMNGSFYPKERSFAMLEPVYDIDERGIEDFMRGEIAREWEMP